MKKTFWLIMDYFSLNILAIFKIPTVAILVLANLFPIIGVLFFDWSLGFILLLFWSESAIIGFFNILKMITVSPLISILMVPFFTLHYGGFMAGHLIFILAISGGLFQGGSGNGSLSWEETALIFKMIYPAFLALFLSHGFSFWINFIGKKEYKETNPGTLMAAPYSRIMLMHFTIILGAFAAVFTGTSSAVLALFIFLKIMVDISAHRKEHFTTNHKKKGRKFLKIEFFEILKKATQSKKA